MPGPVNYGAMAQQLSGMAQPVAERPGLSLDAKSQLLLLAEKHGIPFPDLVRMVQQAQQGKK